MESHLYRLTTASGAVSFVKVIIEPQGEHFASTSVPLDESGRELSQSSLAPKFYGTSPGQAHRRMVQALENSFEEVEAIKMIPTD